MQIKALVLKDGASTPVSHTFAPITPQVGTTPARWTERGTSVRVGDKSLTLSVSDNANGTRKVKGMGTLPEVSSGIDGAPTIVGTVRFNFDVSVPAGVTIQSAKDIHAFLKEFISSEEVRAAIVDGEVVY